jgi:hypothetical protein
MIFIRIAHGRNGNADNSKSLRFDGMKIVFKLAQHRNGGN